MTAITIFQGNDMLETRVVQENGNPVDLTGFTVTSQVRSSVSSNDIAATLTVNITDAPNGVVELSLDATTSQTLIPGAYVYDILRVNGGTRRNTGSAVFTVSDPVTE